MFVLYGNTLAIKDIDNYCITEWEKIGGLKIEIWFSKDKELHQTSESSLLKSHFILPGNEDAKHALKTWLDSTARHWVHLTKNNYLNRSSRFFHLFSPHLSLFISSIHFLPLQEDILFIDVLKIFLPHVEISNSATKILGWGKATVNPPEKIPPYSKLFSQIPQQ